MDEDIVTTTGTVDGIKVAFDWAFVTLRDEDTDINELFILWFVIVDRMLPDLTEFSTSLDTSIASSRVLHSMMLSLLTEAMSQRLRVSIRHEESGSFIRNVEVHGSPLP